MSVFVDTLTSVLMAAGGLYGINVSAAVLVSVTSRSAARRRAALTALAILLRRNPRALIDDVDTGADAPKRRRSAGRRKQ